MVMLQAIFMAAIWPFMAILAIWKPYKIECNLIMWGIPEKSTKNVEHSRRLELKSSFSIKSYLTFKVLPKPHLLELQCKTKSIL